MARAWKNRPPGSNWGEFGDGDQLGRLNLLTEETTLAAAREIRVGKRFCLSLPLDVPATNATNPRRLPPVLHPVVRDGQVAFNLPLERFDPGNTGVVSDDAVLLYNQHSSQWDALAHMGALFDADGDGVAEPVQYNGHRVVDADGLDRAAAGGDLPGPRRGVRGLQVFVFFFPTHRSLCPYSVGKTYLHVLRT